jgi:hypothetical protein
MVVPAREGACVRTLAACGLLLLALAPPAAAQDSYVLIVTGLEGDAEHGAQFFQWASKLVDTVRNTFQLPVDRVVYLAEKPARDPAKITGPATRDSIDKALAGFATRAGPSDAVFIVLFGHGSADGTDARFNLPGPDLSAADFAKLLGRFQTARVVFVDTTSSSGEFVKALAGPRRTILTATRSGAERYDTQFGGFFVEAFSNEAADTNKDHRVSVLEAFTYARSQVQRSFEKEGLLLTEHALLDDDGDGTPTQEPDATKPDGRVAATLYLGTPPLTTASGAPITDPALKALYEQRLAFERRIEELKAIKDTIPAEKYDAELEQLATELAFKNRDIRQREENVK